jgi:hypothetical protein
MKLFNGYLRILCVISLIDCTGSVIAISINNDKVQITTDEKKSPVAKKLHLVAPYFHQFSLYFAKGAGVIAAIGVGYMLARRFMHSELSKMLWRPFDKKVEILNDLLKKQREEFKKDTRESIDYSEEKFEKAGAKIVKAGAKIVKDGVKSFSVMKMIGLGWPSWDRKSKEVPKEKAK